MALGGVRGLDGFRGDSLPGDLHRPVGPAPPVGLRWLWRRYCGDPVHDREVPPWNLPVLRGPRIGLRSGRLVGPVSGVGLLLVANALLRSRADPGAADAARVAAEVSPKRERG